MTSKHTPGPWGVWHEEVYAGPFKRFEGGIKGFRARICEMDDLDLDSDEVEANARLIAAAPELLGALRPVADRGEISAEIIRNARAAIAKATGAGE